MIGANEGGSGTALLLATKGVEVTAAKNFGRLYTRSLAYQMTGDIDKARSIYAKYLGA